MLNNKSLTTSSAIILQEGYSTRKNNVYALCFFVDGRDGVKARFIGLTENDEDILRRTKLGTYVIRATGLRNRLMNILAALAVNWFTE